MDQDLINQLKRHERLAQYFEANRSLIDRIPALKKRVDVYMSRRGTLPVPPAGTDDADGEALKGKRGATQDKDSAKGRLVDLLLPMAAALHLWLLDSDNMPENDGKAARQREIAARLDIRRPSELGKLSGPALAELAQLAVDTVAKIPAGGLTDYGMDAGDVNLFEQAAAAYGIRRNVPREFLQQAGASAHNLGPVLDELDHYVSGELRKVIDTQRGKHADFVRGFKRAYALVGRRGGRPSTETDRPSDEKRPRQTDHDIEHS